VRNIPLTTHEQTAIAKYVAKEILGLVGRTLLIAAASIPCVIIVYAEAWTVASYGFMGEVPFGYYGDFNLVKHNVQHTKCIASASYSRHEDLTIEDFHFSVRTKSGRLIRVWFFDDQDVGRICSAPMGILLVTPGNFRDSDQLYRIEDITNRLATERKTAFNMRDLLCEIDQLAPVFEANYSDKQIPLIRLREESQTWELRACLRLEIVDEQLETPSYNETPIELIARKE